MNVVVGRPPMYEEILKVFPVIAGNDNVIFAWGFTIYTPIEREVSPELLDHERVHAKRQQLQGGPEGWWRKYLDDPQFRLVEELPAHQAQYDRFCKRNTDRNARARYRHHVAEMLASPLYNSVTSFSNALKLIRKA